jgi:hypothetical protein
MNLTRELSTEKSRERSLTFPQTPQTCDPGGLQKGGDLRK